MSSTIPIKKEQPNIPHPLVIDLVSGRARLATQDDIHRMESICVAYGALMRELAEQVRVAERLQSLLKSSYGAQNHLG